MLTMWIRTNSNPQGREVDDCVIRALAEVTGRSWRSVYLALAVSGCEACNMPDSNEVWGGCCETVTVRNVSDQPILVQHANIIFSRPDLAVTR